MTFADENIKSSVEYDSNRQNRDVDLDKNEIIKSIQEFFTKANHFFKSTFGVGFID